VRFALDLYLSVFICVHLRFHRFFFLPCKSRWILALRALPGPIECRAFYAGALSRQVSLMVRR